MPERANQRLAADLGDYPDLVVIYLGFRATGLKSLGALMRLGGQIRRAVAERPDGLLLHENLTFSLFPPHLGMRQYWRDMESLERWTRTGMHQTWWRQFNRDTRGAQFWHELYRLKGGMEGIISHLDHRPGFWTFAGERPAQGAWTTARGRLGACPMDADRRAA